jgi:hypothetical protein
LRELKDEWADKYNGVAVAGYDGDDSGDLVSAVLVLGTKYMEVGWGTSMDMTE